MMILKVRHILNLLVPLRKWASRFLIAESIVRMQKKELLLPLIRDELPRDDDNDSGFGRNNDPVRVYLRRMGSVELLDRAHAT